MTNAFAPKTRGCSWGPESGPFHLDGPRAVACGLVVLSTVLNLLGIKRAARVQNVLTALKVAVLAALNIADEVFTLRDRQQRIEGPLRKRVEKCVSLVEKALEHAN